MAKIQTLPAPASPSTSSSSGEHQQGRQAYTVWMKSLVFNCNGCTVYTLDGGVAFRVDNYGSRGGREVFFMDRDGNALIRIRRKGFGMFRSWEVCRCTHDAGEEEATPWFSMRRAEKGGASVTMHGGAGTCYTVDGCCARKSEYRVNGAGGAVVAEVARKQTVARVVLRDDVLSLTVGLEVDHLLALGLVVVCGLMNRSL